jgi:hypothetical protein
MNFWKDAIPAGWNRNGPLQSSFPSKKAIIYLGRTERTTNIPLVDPESSMKKDSSGIDPGRSWNLWFETDKT